MKILNLKPKESPDAAKTGDAKAADSKAPDAALGGDILAKAKELSKNAVKGMVNTGDSILKSLKLDENEQVKKMAEDAKKFLKQTALLDEEFENEEYY